jgi:hypothetical protein
VASIFSRERSSVSTFFGSVWFMLLVATILWAAYLIPFMLYAKFFPLDLPGIFIVSDNLREYMHFIISPYRGAGRYFPFYWLFNCLNYYLFGTSVGQYYIVQSSIFGMATLFIISVFYKLTKSRSLSVALLVGIYFSTPVAENLATIGKAESISYFFIAWILLLFSRASVLKNSSEYNGNSTSNYILMGIGFVLALWTKETSLVLVGFCMSGLLFSFLMRRVDSGRRDYFLLLATLVCAFFISRLPYFIFYGERGNENSYISYNITIKIIQDNIIFYTTQQPDVLLTGLISILLLYTIGKKLYFCPKNRGKDSFEKYVLVVSLCCMACGYYGVFLMWRWPQQYYMLLPAVIFKFCAFYGLYIASTYSLIKKTTKVVVVIGIVVCVVYSAASLYYVGACQIAYSMIYTEAIEKVAHLIDGKNALVIESYPFYSEQIGGTGQLFKVALNKEIRTNGIADALDPAVPTPEILKLLSVTQQQLDDNYKNFPRRGDYLLVFTGDMLAHWFLRGVAPYNNEDSLLKEQNAYDMSLVAQRRLSFPAFFINVWTKKVSIDTVGVGYKIYRILEDEPKILWRGRYPDGWVGNDASLEVNPSYNMPIVVKYSSPYFALPNRLTIFKNGEMFKDIAINDTNEQTLVLSEQPNSPVFFEFKVGNACSPKSVKLNNDFRVLGLRLSLDKVH